MIRDSDADLCTGCQQDSDYVEMELRTVEDERGDSDFFNVITWMGGVYCHTTYFVSTLIHDDAIVPVLMSLDLQ